MLYIRGKIVKRYFNEIKRKSGEVVTNHLGEPLLKVTYLIESDKPDYTSALTCTELCSKSELSNCIKVNTEQSIPVFIKTYNGKIEYCLDNDSHTTGSEF